MIFNVTHTISAGNMTTKFKGMKLSRNPLPYNSSWYMFRPENYDDEIGEQGNFSGAEEGSVEEFSNNDNTKLKLVLNRTELTPRYTMGKLYIDGEFFCDIVEDTVRDISKGNCVKKVDHETAIPYGTYQVSVNIPSQKFDPRADYKAVCGNYHVPMVMDVPCFSGIRIHKGSSASSSWGCLIVGNKSTTEAGRVVNSEEVFKKLFPILRKAEIDDKKKIEITIVNKRIAGNSQSTLDSAANANLDFAKGMGTVSGGEGLEHKGKFSDPKVFTRTIYNAFLHYGVSETIAVCMTAQAALESTWGTSTYAGYSNYGGINHHDGDAGPAPGTSRHGHIKATYNNVGHYVEQKLGIMDRLYPGAKTAQTATEYFDIIQGGNPRGYCYGGETPQQRAEYGQLIMGMIPSVKRRLT